MMRPATADEIRRWDELVAAAPGGSSFWQQLTYARLKTAWRPVLAIHELADVELPVLYLQKRLPGFGTYWYAPCGPRVADAAQFAAVCDDLRACSPAFAVTMEPPLAAADESSAGELAAGIEGLQPSADVQLGLHTVAVDLSGTEEEVLASFKQRARRAIRKAQKAGAVVEGPLTSPEALDVMWELYRETGERNGLMIRDRTYHQAFWEAYLRRGQGRVFIARAAEDGEPGAAAFALHAGPLALYKDGGSLRTREASGLQYLLQWEIMRWARSQGARVYDMFGAPPSWRADDETHGMHGLVQFKTGFAPISDEVGALTLALRPRTWMLWERGGRRVVDQVLARRHEYFY